MSPQIWRTPLGVDASPDLVYVPSDDLGFSAWNEYDNDATIELIRDQLWRDFLRDPQNDVISDEEYGRRYAQMHKTAIENAKAIARRRFLQRNWTQLRKLIYERDGGICQVCLTQCEYELYECGHIIDRLVGGRDLPSNLVCMCVSCNRCKDVTETIAKYVSWVIEFRGNGAWWCKSNDKLERLLCELVHIDAIK